MWGKDVVMQRESVIEGKTLRLKLDTAWPNLQSPVVILTPIARCNG